MGDRGAADIENAARIGTHQDVPFGVDGVSHGLFNLNTGIIDHDVEATGIAHQLRYLLRIGDIALLPGDVLRQVARTVSPATDQQIGIFAEKGLRNGPANALPPRLSPALFFLRAPYQWAIMTWRTDE